MLQFNPSQQLGLCSCSLAPYTRISGMGVENRKGREKLMGLAKNSLIKDSRENNNKNNDYIYIHTLLIIK